jgi:hypothetical protein
VTSRRVILKNTVLVTDGRRENMAQQTATPSTNPHLSLKDLRENVLRSPLGYKYADLYQNKWDYSLYGYDTTHMDFESLPMTDIRDPNRQTGRTSDMLWEAAKVKDCAEPVLIIVHNQRMIRVCIDSLPGGWWGLDPRDFMSVQEASRAIRGRYVPEAVFIDHFVETLTREDRHFAETMYQLRHDIEIGRRHRSQLPVLMSDGTYIQP